MSQISKRRIHPKVEEKIRRLLVESVALCRDQQVAANFLDVLLTSTEKIMIAKRIAIALMLIKGYSAAEIDEKLKVSLTTIASVKTWLDLKGKEYLGLLNELVKQDERGEQEATTLRAEAESFWSLPPKTNWKDQRRDQ